jgi:predicted kinase
MPTLTITRGLPASGKTTYARAWVAQDPSSRVRVNRDDLRLSMFGAPFLDYALEAVVSTAQRAQVEALLRAGRDVIVDDTNLRAKYARAWADLAAACGARFQWADFPIPLDVCLARDAARDRPVGEMVIKGMHDRYLAAGRGFAPVTVTATDAAQASGSLYTPDPTLPPAWIVDVDGTLALRQGPNARSPYDWHRVGEDLPNPPVVELVEALADHATIVVMSGRDECCRADTEAWLTTHVPAWTELHMRPRGDMRRDAIVKRELFETHVAPHWNVIGVIDDRASVIKMWRSIGLMAAQVADGNF